MNGNQFCQLHFCLASQFGSTLKRKNLLLWEQILSFRSRPPLEGFLCTEKHTRSHISCFCMIKQSGKNMVMCPYTLNNEGQEIKNDI